MNILVGYDGLEHSRAAIDDLQRAGLAAAGEAIVLTVVEWPTDQALKNWGMAETDWSPEWTDRIHAAKSLAAEGAERLRSFFPLWNIRSETEAGDPGDRILEKARQWPADLIVIGTHGRSVVGRAVLGSVSMKLVRNAGCAVRVVRASAHEPAIRLLVATDGSPAAAEAVTEVTHRSWPAGTEARVLAVHQPLIPLNAERIVLGEDLYDSVNENDYKRLTRAANSAAEKLREAGISVVATVAQGDPKHILVERAKDWHIDTVFAGARGLGGVDRLLLGSVSSAAVAHAPCTVEIVHRKLRVH